MINSTLSQLCNETLTLIALDAVCDATETVTLDAAGAESFSDLFVGLDIDFAPACDYTETVAGVR